MQATARVKSTNVHIDRRISRPPTAVRVSTARLPGVPAMPIPSARPGACTARRCAPDGAAPLLPLTGMRQ